MAIDPDSVRDVQRLVRNLDTLVRDAIYLRSCFSQHTDQLLNIPRHLSLIATDIENALMRAHFVDDILTANSGIIPPSGTSS